MIDEKLEAIKRLAYVHGMFHRMWSESTNPIEETFALDAMNDLNEVIDYIENIVMDDEKPDSEACVTYQVFDAQFQGLQRFTEDEPDEKLDTSFAEGSGRWFCYRFGDGDKKYLIQVKEMV